MIRYIAVCDCVTVSVLAFLALCLAANPIQAQVTYDGRDANAPWRTVADAQIDAIRKADVQLQIELPNGTAVTGAQVSVQMKKHEFHFGSAVDPRYFLNSESQFNQNYADKVSELFTVTTLENHLKWRTWPNVWVPILKKFAMV